MFSIARTLAHQPTSSTSEQLNNNSKNNKNNKTIIFGRTASTSGKRNVILSATKSENDGDDTFVKAEDSSRFRRKNAQESDADEEKPKGILGGLVSNLPTLRKDSAPDSYGNRPRSKTLEEGRYKRPTTVRSGNVDESTVRGEDFEVVEGGPGIGLLVTLLFGAAVLGGAYLTVQKLSAEPPSELTQKRQSRRMPSEDKSTLQTREQRNQQSSQPPAPTAPPVIVTVEDMVSLE